MTGEREKQTKMNAGKKESKESGTEIKRATRADVARLAGVSETIVSYVINNNRYVAEEKRKRVEQAVRELNYRPNAIARALRKKTSHQILLIGDAIMDEYYSELLSNLDCYAYENGYLVSLCKYHNVDSYLARVLSNQFDGIIINSAGFKEEYIRRLTGAGIPVVLFLGKKYTHIPAGVATIDSGLFQGTKQGLEMLRQKGAETILYLAEPLKRCELKKDIRFLAFQEISKKHGLSDERILAQTFTGYGELEWERHFADHLARHPEIDAIFARNDGLAAAATKVARTVGKRIPQDLMILGVDNSSVSRLMTPTISTIELAKAEMSKAAIELIARMKQGEKEEIHRLFRTKLVERESTAKPLEK